MLQKFSEGKHIPALIKEMDLGPSTSGMSMKSLNKKSPGNVSFSKEALHTAALQDLETHECFAPERLVVSLGGSHAAQPMVVRNQRHLRRQGVEAADAQYFDSYSHFGIHREMLSDKVSILDPYCARLPGPSLSYQSVLHLSD